MAQCVAFVPRGSFPDPCLRLPELPSPRAKLIVGTTAIVQTHHHPWPCFMPYIIPTMRRAEMSDAMSTRDVPAGPFLIRRLRFGARRSRHSLPPSWKHRRHTPRSCRALARPATLHLREPSPKGVKSTHTLTTTPALMPDRGHSCRGDSQSNKPPYHLKLLFNNKFPIRLDRAQLVLFLTFIICTPVYSAHVYTLRTI
jgi:hypothetical protein